MFAKGAQWTVDRLIDRQIINREDREIYRFGLESGMLKAVHYLTMLLVGIVLGMLAETILFLAAYSLIRAYGGGYHADTRGVCYLLSWVTIIGVLLVARFLSGETAMLISAVLTVFAFPVIFIKAPVENSAKPLDEEECCHYKKRARFVLIIQAGAVIILNLFFTGKFGLIIAESLGLEAMMMLLGVWKNGR
ncbi:MAG: accessory gene regulator B family protein [Eubacterium sp.]